MEYPADETGMAAVVLRSALIVPLAIPGYMLGSFRFAQRLLLSAHFFLLGG